MQFNSSLLVCILLLPAALPAAQQQPEPPAVAPPAQTAPAPVTPTTAGDEREPDGTVSFGVNYWLAGFKPALRTGLASVTEQPSNLDFVRKNRGATGATLSIPAGRHNALRFSYFRVQGGSDLTAPEDVALYSTAYSKGDLLNTSYTLQNAKISLDFLSWPFPLGESKWRVKTLWEVQYTMVRAGFAAPLKASETGDYTNTMSKGSVGFFYPSLGMGVEHLTTKHFRWGANASGFAIPHRPVLWNADVYAAYRHGQMEFTAGGRAFHFKTSPHAEQYMRGTLAGVYAGLRWYLKD